ncbi:hypothetical protein [Streptomyces sp. NPDC007904]|jgi:hypothetical protein|uniref:hypothetical protein n=1 Tax=Streptomyces sp. NPDC007904 TaxID=3364787 RepID=UPI0036E42A63
MSDGKDARREEREARGPRSDGAAREPDSRPAPGGAPEAGADASADTGEGEGPGTPGGRDASDGRDGPGRTAESGRPLASVPPEEPAWLRALVEPHGQEPKQSHAGNGTVNHGPDEQSPEGLGSDELTLRTMLHQAVREVEPSDGTLDYLRRAVPARRARKRQALVGMAAAALFVGTAVPALVHVSNSTGPDANPSAVGHASQTQGGTGEGKEQDGGQDTGGGPSDTVQDGGKGDEKDKDEGGAGTGSSTGVTEGADPSSSSVDGMPACTAAQLGPAVPNSAGPDSVGTVYGSFRVTNVSTASCTVGDPGGVSVAALGAADPAKVTTTRHVAGDAASGLPDPSLEAGQVVLKPGASYEVKFAWVPSEPCPTAGGDTGGTGDPSPDPSPTENPATTTGTSTGTDAGTTTQLVTEDGTVDGGVTVSYTAPTGSGTGSTTVGNACAGTVYWTGLLTAL